MKKEKIYGIYRGDEFVTVGTLKECAEHLGVKENTIRFMTTPSYAKRRKDDGNSLVAFLVE
ncbi:hypothetical protein KHA93_11695 [Bacillus sp. FJAT-49732]|uniref:Uncharacterized protein n=1 Tax=Lederbergia citrisecunda TaxID=2833583 RepID=A0A942TR21_9BACI|nr:hypothetical protein [Lederbergia citrisecunda]MBS4200294.1 hypothetical protein [Lederbergia citrisecunda]